MTVWLVTRHQGAKDWILQEKIKIDQHVQHLDISQISANDIVIGTLPVHLAAKINQLKARYIHLNLETPENLRGKELTAIDVRKCGGKLQEYKIEQINHLYI